MERAPRGVEYRAVVTAPEKTKGWRKRNKPHDPFALASDSTPAPRRSDAEISKIDLWSVLKVSLCFYLAALALFVVAGVVLWLIADAFGAIGNIESFMGKILSSKNYHLVSLEILEGSVLVGLVLVALMTLLTVLGAALYNFFADIVGGVEVRFVESDRR
jgi:Transmembrane domain of unknown function (DUF3566)